MTGKPKIGMYWAASCGGCEISLVNIHEKILDVDAAFDFYFCPCLLDTKVKDVEALPDGGIAVMLMNGGMRTSENEEMARLLRRKSQVLVAFGSCASEGCIPGLANLHHRATFLDDIYTDNVSTVNPDGVTPETSVEVPEGTLTLPAFTSRLRPLSSVVDVDYFMPGCPPEPHQIAAVLDVLITGGALPQKGSVIGAGTRAVCDECARERSEKKVRRFYRTWEIEADPETCLLEQGLLCMGVATRSGCGGLCPEVNMPCIGCYGPPPGALDQGARMVAALGSVLDVEPLKNLSEEDMHARLDETMAAIPDYAGTFYKFSLAASILGGRVR